MAFLDFLINKDDIEEQRQIADQAARARFDPDVLLPQLEQAQEVGREGIADDEIRSTILERIFSQSIEPSALGRGMGSGRTLSFIDRLNQARTKQLGQAETQLALEEEKAKRVGQQQEATIESKRAGIRSQREARLKENQLKAQAEASRRKRQLGATIGKLAGTAAGAIPGLGIPASIGIGAGAGLLFGGGEGAAIGGLTGGLSRANLGTGEERTPTTAEQLGELINQRTIDRILNLEAEEARPDAVAPEDNILPADIDFGLGNRDNPIDLDELELVDRLMRGEGLFFN